jgi:U32 family peptidase
VTLPELLAPAGDFASIDAAIDHGADALYVGIGQFNLRAHAPNFTIDDVPELLQRIHSRKKRVYFALNTMPDTEMLLGIERFLQSLLSVNMFPDAFIVSDPGVIELCSEVLPNIALHLSTQTGTFNYRSMQFWKKMGIKRVVLPRELSLEQITALNALSIMETEVFIHGAMCVSISGRCLMGAYMSQRHPNHGDCPQPCRWKYRIAANPSSASHRAIQENILDAEENDEGTYLLNSKDLCTIDLLPEIIRSGVSALKIEGRNKSEHYVGTVVKAYRAALDEFKHGSGVYAVSPEWKTLLESIEHRPYTTGFYNKELSLQEIVSSKATASTRIIGIVKALLPGGIPVIDVKNSFSLNEPIEILPVNQFKMPFTLTFSHLTDLSGNEIIKPPSNRLIVAHGSCKLQPGDMLRKNNMQ